MKKVEIRLAEIDDSSEILNIYEPYVKNTYITFEYEVPTLEEFQGRIRNTLIKYPWLVCEADGKIAGYAYASNFRDRAAYTWSVELSIYAAPEYHGNKIGTALYRALLDILKLQGYDSAYAVITYPNEKSEHFHEIIGFKPVGIFHNAGYKFNKWHGIKCYELKLGEYPEVPQPPRKLEDIRYIEEFRSIMKKWSNIINAE